MGGATRFTNAGSPAPIFPLESAIPELQFSHFAPFLSLLQNGILVIVGQFER
jgi:hypothetical protein